MVLNGIQMVVDGVICLRSMGLIRLLGGASGAGRWLGLDHSEVLLMAKIIQKNSHEAGCNIWSIYKHSMHHNTLEA